jgi:hypothetical protein
MALSLTSGSRSKSKLPPETTATTDLPFRLAGSMASSAAIESAPAGSSTMPSVLRILVMVRQIAFSGTVSTCSARNRCRISKLRSPISATAAPSTKLSIFPSLTL